MQVKFLASMALGMALQQLPQDWQQRHGYRIFAVDGSKLNLPRPLAQEGYRTPSSNAHYPQGLLSCLYQLRSRIPVDFDLLAHGNERLAALAHLRALACCFPLKFVGIRCFLPELSRCRSVGKAD